MTPRKKNPGKRGRKAAVDADRLEQLTVRLSPALKFGLELLSRAQHRSLSDTMQWAITVGLNSYSVGDDRTALGDLVAAAWAEDSESRRLLRVYRTEPSLLSFEDQCVCHLVDYSVERSESLEEEAARRSGLEVWKAEQRRDPEPSFPLPQELWERHKAIHDELEYLFYNFVRLTWLPLRAKAVELADQGKLLVGQSLVQVLNLDLFNERIDGSWYAMQHLVDYHKKNIETDGSDNNLEEKNDAPKSE